MSSLLDRLLGRKKEEKKEEERIPSRVDEDVARARREQLARERQQMEEARKQFEEREKARLAALEEEKKRKQEEEAAKLSLEERQQLAARARETAGRVYVVKPGDSLSKIAKEVYGDAKRWPEIYEANKELIGPDPNLIHPGQNLRIP
ncbi:MAG: LysM peptidoglycan-binding domain-containing protein [Chloroflexi bacterium]|nr:LysM peptidoglycan-binding domain-containing protein [Chloroflexota bacterium]